MVKAATIIALGGLATVNAFSLPSLNDVSSSLNNAVASMPNVLTRRAGGTTCPAIWSTISTQLTASFLDKSTGQCTDLARAAIRFAFHDAGTYSKQLAFYAPAAGGADASLLLSPDEINRPENGGLQDYYTFLTNFWTPIKASVSAADLIQFAASHATLTCPGGPKVKTVVGRTDTTTGSYDGLLPAGFGPNASHDVLFALFQTKGFSAKDLAALIGAHTSSKAFTQQAHGIPVGGAQDTSPGKWDIDYYAQTVSNRTDIYRFESDVNLANINTAVGKEFNGFINNQGKWAAAYADAMARMSLLGIPATTSQNFIDCTGALPKGTSAKRDIRAAPINNRAR